MPKSLALLLAGLSVLLLAACDTAEPPIDPVQSTSTLPTAPETTFALEQQSLPITPQIPLDNDFPPKNGEFSPLEWDTLIPEDWRPDKLMAEYPIGEISDDDPRADELMKKLKALWDASPVVPGLDGKLVKLAGFVVPLEMDAETIGEFLLVPYYGACIHVPPPPSNQTVYIRTAEGAEYRGGLFDTVWVSGTLRVESVSSGLAEAGYRIQAIKVEAYE